MMSSNVERLTRDSRHGYASEIPQTAQMGSVAQISVEIDLPWVVVPFQKD
jgi:hypothetical protein